MTTIGLLHPGAMGSAVGGLLAAAGHEVRWVSEGRSTETRDRAGRAGLKDTVSIQALVGLADVIVSICPPAAAQDVADAVADERFTGLYVDANAIAPATAERIAARLVGGGADVVDGSIIGGPPADAGTTRLYLSGGRAAEVADWFDGTALEALVVGDAVGPASAIKVAYAGWSKGSAALLLSMRAYARATGVEQALLDEWGRSVPEARDDSAALASRIHLKAWRYEGEMRQIAAALDAAGLPGGFHAAAADVYRQLADLRHAGEDQPPGDTLDRIIDR